jgi:quercetin dioxygenase-like cupin family protein
VSVAGPVRGPFDTSGIEVRRAWRTSASRRDIEAALGAEGLTTHGWGNGPDVSYGQHAHPHDKVLCCVSGSIVFHADSGDMALMPGDRMEIEAGVEHSATVGHDGVECVEAYRS